MNLPGHIIKKSEKWYYNSKSGKYILASKIKEWCENYWKHHDAEEQRRVERYKKEINLARKRWDDES